MEIWFVSVFLSLFSFPFLNLTLLIYLTYDWPGFGEVIKP